MATKEIPRTGYGSKLLSRVEFKGTGISPFVGRLDDRSEDGMDLVRNIKEMYARSDGHVHVLAASIRTVNHLLCSFTLSAELATVPTTVLDGWAATGFPMPDQDFRYRRVDASGKPLKAITYKELDLNLPWQSFDITHELTTKVSREAEGGRRSTKKNKGKNGTQTECRFLGMRWNVT